MVLYGYARVSTADQECTLQEQALRVEEHLGASAIARRLEIGWASVYRALARRDGTS